MIRALEWTVVVLFWVAWLGMAGYAAKRLLTPTQAREDERTIRQTFAADGCKVLRIDPPRRRPAFPREDDDRTYTVLVKPQGGRATKRKVEFSGRSGQPTIVY
jgi:hypothetical protein